MSLLGSIQLASNAIRATQIGLQVVGQNIANANTPGYVRAEVQYVPAPTQREGNLLLGLGVNVHAVVQRVDKFLQERLRGATSDRSGTEVQEQTFAQLEALIGELNSTDLSTKLDEFINSISEILTQPEADSVRNLAVLRGQALTIEINRLATGAGQDRSNINDRIAQRADDINRLLEEVAKLNVQIANAEGGDVIASDAVGLRDQRLRAMQQLAELVDVKTQEQANGSVSVFIGGDFLVLDGRFRSLEVTQTADRGLTINQLRIAESDSLLDIGSGEVAGLIAARDDILAGFLDTLNHFAGTLAFEFNKVFSSAQGLRGYRSITSESDVDDVDAALDAAGLSFTPVNGQFEIQVFNRRTGLTQTRTIRVDLNGLDGDTSLTQLAAAIDDVNGVTATVTPGRRLMIESESSDQEIAFAGDTSGVLAALGINTFFTGADARSLGVNAAIETDPAKFAASRAGIGIDTLAAEDLVNFLDAPLASQGGTTLLDLYDRLIAGVTQGSAVAHSLAEGSRVFEKTLAGQDQAISGVNIDEETVRLIQYQRAFQASARYISTLSELLELLVNL